MTEATLFVGGHVLAAGRRAEALLLENGKVLAAGPEASVRRSAPTGTDRVDLDGGLVVPGLADAHLHLGEIARARLGFDAGAPRSIPRLLAALAAWAETHPGPAVAGRGLDPERLAERRWPTLAELDATVADRAVVLLHASGHAAVLNTAGLERSGVSRGRREAPSPPSEILLEGELRSIAPLLEATLPLTAEALEYVCHELAAAGLTAVGTMNVGTPELAALHELDDAGRLPIRVRAYVPLAHPVPRSEGQRLAVVGAKGFLDGAFGPRTASLEAPYTDEPSSRGLDREADAEVERALATASENGLIPALHAIGDRAVARAARLLGRARRPGRSARIEHASLTPPSILPALVASGAELVVQPGFVLTDVWLRARLGPERSRWAYAFRTLSDLGIPLAGSSDAPFDAADPWRGMRAAVQRYDELGRSANPANAEALPEDEALALYTTGAHRALGRRAGGTLAVGGPADLTIVSVPTLGAALRRGAEAVRETWVDGRPVWRRSPR